jgi:hypothetical protein
MPRKFSKECSHRTVRRRKFWSQAKRRFISSDASSDAEGVHLVVVLAVVSVWCDHFDFGLGERFIEPVGVVSIIPNQRLYWFGDEDAQTAIGRPALSATAMILFPLPRFVSPTPIRRAWASLGAPFPRVVGSKHANADRKRPSVGGVAAAEPCSYLLPRLGDHSTARRTPDANAGCGRQLRLSRTDGHSRICGKTRKPPSIRHGLIDHRTRLAPDDVEQGPRSLGH